MKREKEPAIPEEEFQHSEEGVRGPEGYPCLWSDLFSHRLWSRELDSENNQGLPPPGGQDKL